MALEPVRWDLWDGAANQWNGSLWNCGRK